MKLIKTTVAIALACSMSACVVVDDGYDYDVWSGPDEIRYGWYESGYTVNHRHPQPPRHRFDDRRPRPHDERGRKIGGPHEVWRPNGSHDRRNIDRPQRQPDAHRPAGTPPARVLPSHRGERNSGGHMQSRPVNREARPERQHAPQRDRGPRERPRHARE